MYITIPHIPGIIAVKQLAHFGVFVLPVGIGSRGGRGGGGGRGRGGGGGGRK